MSRPGSTPAPPRSGKVVDAGGGGGGGDDDDGALSLSLSLSLSHRQFRVLRRPFARLRCWPSIGKKVGEKLDKV